MKIVTWAASALALWLGVVGCQGESTDPDVPSSDPLEARIAELAVAISTITAGTPTGNTKQEGEVTTHVTEEGASLPCAQYWGPPNDTAPDGRFIAWTPEGSHILFDDGSRVMKVDVAGTQVDTVVDANPGHRLLYGFHADLSPDGARIVYSSCEYPTGEIDMSMADAQSEREKYRYEIGTVAVDGSASERLTESSHNNHYPVWSPDMTHMAFLSSSHYLSPPGTLRIMRADGMHQRAGAPEEWPPVYVTAASPPLWSPDGQRIAFLGYPPGYWEGEWPNHIPWALYTVPIGDNTALSRVSDHTGAAAWSPDGRRIAVARVEGEEVVLSTIAPDGSDPRRLIKITDRETSFSDYYEYGRFGRYLGPVSWSPDGTHILYVCEAGVCVVDLDGNLVGQSPMDLMPEEGRPYTAWSPDGSRIAVRSPGLTFGESPNFTYPAMNPHANGAAAVFTMAPDGTDVQVLVRGGRTGASPVTGKAVPSLVAENARYRDVEVGIASCSQGYVVPDPQGNPGLVKDCETLIGLRDTLAGDAIIPWDPRTPIDQWEGIVLGGSPPRVVEVLLTGSSSSRAGGSRPGLVVMDYRLNGILPPQLGDLDALELLDLWGNYLSGEIPPELGKLPNLRLVDLIGNQELTGCLPDSIGSISYSSAELRRCP